MTGADGRDEPVGVLGGLGPAATVHFMQRVIELTDAARDQDHLDLLVWQHGSIPDRTAFLLGEGESPVPALVADAGETPEPPPWWRARMTRPAGDGWAGVRPPGSGSRALTIQTRPAMSNPAPVDRLLVGVDIRKGPGAAPAWFDAAVSDGRMRQ